jgi:RNA polymerase sigma-70 factor (ECF subfamily)
MSVHALHSAGAFPTTHWSEVYSAREAEQEKGRAALGRLLERYQPALLNHLKCKFLLPEAEAQDLWQTFVLDKVLERALLAKADPGRGRFRTFVLNALDHFVISHRRHDRARGRRPPAGFVPLDDLGPAQEPRREDRPADRTEVIWAQVVLAGALLNLHHECEAQGRMDIWGVFEGRLVRPLLDDAAEVDYEELIDRFGFQSPSQAFNTLNTAKRMFRRHLRAVVAEYARDHVELEEELGYLKRILARGR